MYLALLLSLAPVACTGGSGGGVKAIEPGDSGGAIDSGAAGGDAVDGGPSVAGDTGGATSVGGKDGQTLEVSPTDYGTLHASWACVEGGELSISGASTSWTLTAGGCPRELEVSAPPGTTVTFTMPVIDSEAAPWVLTAEPPDLPDAIYEVGRGLSLEGELFDDGVMVLGYEFFQNQPEPYWGSGALVILDGRGRHLAHVYSPPEDEQVHKSALLDPSRGELIYTLFNKARDSEGMAGNQLGRVALGGVPEGDEFSAVDAPQGHHFLDRSDDGAIQYLDVERVCSYSDSSETLAYDRILELGPDGSQRVIFDSSVEWVPTIVERLGVRGAFDAALGGYSLNDCPGGSQEVRDVTHLNGVDCRDDLCLISGIGSIVTALIVDRATGEIRYDLSTYDIEPPGAGDTLLELHDVQWVGDDRFLAFHNGPLATGAYPSLYRIDHDRRVLTELWTTRGAEDCIQASAMGWVSGIDGSGFEDFLAGDLDAGGARMILSYGTGGVVTVEGVDGRRLGRLDFDVNDAEGHRCGAAYSAKIYAGQVEHYSDAALREAFPDWIRLD